MKTVLNFALSPRDPLPDEFALDDVRFPRQLVEYFLNEYTVAGDTVLDPFCGFGTTLKVCEEMGRTGIGIEFLEDRANYVKSLVADPTSVLVGDATKLNELGLSQIDFAITSPPYTFVGDDVDALKANTEPSNGYTRYLEDIRVVFSHVCELLKPGGRLVVNVENNYMSSPVTFLAWDVAREVVKTIPFEKEMIVTRAERESEPEHEYCFVFRKSD